MKRELTIAKLKEHEAELKQLGVEHLYLFGSTTARDEARGDSDVDLFFDHPEGSLGLFELMDIKDAAEPSPDPATEDRSRRPASVLMASSSSAARLIDITEAIELIRAELSAMTIQSFQTERREQWLAERGLEIISEASRRLP